ncbi:MAG: TraB/GumN family protein, partial [Brevundimonas sp.]
MTLANRMGRTANHVSRMAFGACAALAASAVLAAFPGAAHAEQVVAPAPAVAPIPRAEGAGPPMWVIKDADSTVYLF